MFDPSRNFLLLKLIYHLRRLRAFLPRRHSAVDDAERLRGAFYEKIWADAAAELGAQCKQLGHGILELSKDGRVTRVQQNITAIDDPVTHLVALNKVLVNQLLATAGLPIARSVTFTLATIGRAAAFLEQVGRPCVVKPASGTGGGQGITTGIRTGRQLGWAATIAAQACTEMLLEEQIAGNNYRLLFLDGVLLDAIERRPPCIVGDGRSTIRQLVAATNAARLSPKSWTVDRGPRTDRTPGAVTLSPGHLVTLSFSQVLIAVDADMRHTLAERGLTLASIPAANDVIAVKTVISQNAAADNVTVTDRLHPLVTSEAARAARTVGVRLAGVDIITRDPTVPLEQSGGIILEVNTTPGFHYHYGKSDGTYPVAVRVLRELLG